MLYYLVEVNINISMIVEYGACLGGDINKMNYEIICS